MDHIGKNLHALERNIEIIGADPVTRHGFTQVPNFILTNKELTVGAKLAYAMLLKYAWDDDACFPGQLKLADDMGSGERSIRTYLKELEDAKFLEVDSGAWQDQPLSPAPDRAEEGMTGLPALTGKFCRSRPATIAAPERQNLPLTLYKNTQFKNTHLKILSLQDALLKGTGP